MSLTGLLQIGSPIENDRALVLARGAGPELSISFGDLHQSCISLTEKLQTAGVVSGDVIGLVSPHSFDTAMALVGLATSGLTCAPMDPVTSKNRFEEILKETGAKLLLVPPVTEADSTYALEAAESLGIPAWRFQPYEPGTKAIKVVPVGQATITPQPIPERGPAPIAAKPTDVAFLLHTSGTTSRPKLVPITHGAVAANLEGLIKTYALSSKDVALHVLPFFHVAGIVIGLLSTLAAGGCVVIHHVFDPLAFPQLLRKHKVTWFTAVPAIFKALLEHKGLFETQSGLSSALRFVRSGAAAMNSKDVEQLEALLGVPLVDSYGMTETGGGCVSTLPGIVTPPGSAGVAISASLEIKICDDGGKEMPPGEAGEVCLRGPSITPGYVDNPEANRESFFGDRWFRTGDLGYLSHSNKGPAEVSVQRNANSWNHSSSLSAGPWLVLTGRKKEMINRGGEKVSPAEVEDAALLVEAVHQAVAFPMADATYGEQVAVAVVRRHGFSGFEVLESLAYAVLASCKRCLPVYMVPTIIFVLNDDSILPKTSTGKVQRMATLAKLTAAGIEPTLEASLLNARIISSLNFVPPESALEEATVQIWQKVLGLLNIGVLDDFFELGGTSILAARIAFMVQEHSAKSCSGAFVLQHRSVRALCKAIESLPSPVPSQAPSPLDYATAPVASPPTLSFGQEQMLMLHSRDPKSGFYNQPLILGLFGSVDIERLHKCIESLVARHDALRTTYTTRGGVWVARIHSSPQITLQQVDLSHTELGIDSGEFEKMLVQESFMPFNLFKELPIRAQLYTLSSCHVLLLIVHHIATDGWSMNIIQNELAAMYRSSCSVNDTVPLPSVEVPYTAYARWQREQSTSETYQVHLNYWKQQLTGIEPLLLQPDHQRPVVQKYDGALHTFRVSADILAGLKRFSQAHGATLFMTTLAAFQIHMYKLTGMERFAVGSPAAGRGQRSLEGTIGYFVNPLALVADLSGNPTVAELLDRVKTATFDGLDNASVPFAEIVEHVRLERSTSYAPIFQLMFVLQERALDSTRSLDDALEMKQQRLSSGVTAKFDLTLELFDEGDAGLLGRMEYCTALFDADTVQRWSQQFTILLHQLCQASDLKALTINGLSVMPDAEHTIIQKFSMAEQRPEYVSAPLVHDAFDAIAASCPNKRCLCFEGEWLSYGEVAQRVAAGAARLSSLGVGPGVVVGLLLERDFDLVISIMAVLKAGGCYLPCDPSYPDDRLEVYLEDAKAALLLANPQHLVRAKDMVGDDVPVVDVSIAADVGSSSALRSPGPDDPAYIIFTSGSTGRPKGVVIAHRGLRDLIPWLVDRHKIVADDVAILTSTISFDAHVLQMFPPLIVGASLVLAESKGHLDPSYIVNLLMQHRVNEFIFSVPTLAREYVNELRRSGYTPYPLMKSWSVGGENVPAELFRDMQDVFPQACIMNVYGPTEVTAVTVHHPFPRKFESVVIGKPDPNTHVYIVDSELRAVPVGVPGELLLSGPRLALGYAGQPDLTAEKFVPNPCLDLVSGRVEASLAPYYEKAYRTGDLVRWRNDGTIDFLGRIDRQVKITGVRIELGEVEAALEGAEGVTGAVAAAVADPTGKQRLVGYITPGTVDTVAISAHCRGLLVAAMVPSVVVALNAFPLLPNGKVDVRALPAPDWSGAGEEEYVAPVDDIEIAVQSVFAEVLGRPAEDVSVLSDFFAAGGTSLQVFRAAALLQKALHIATVPATLVHSERTARRVAAALTQLIADGGGAEDGASAAPIPCNEWPDASRPLSANQEQMWLLSSLAGASAYNMPSALDFFDHAPDAKLLGAALDSVAARHEVLRTVFKRQRDGSIVGAVLPAAEFHVPVQVVQASSEEEVVREVAAEAARAFDLETEPLVRARLLVRDFSGGAGAVLALTMHHAVGDAWSQGIFWRELSAAYDAALNGKSPEWSPLPIQYGDYAAWQRDQLTGASGESLRAFWRKTLAGAPAMAQLPQDRPRPSKPTFLAGVARSSLPEGLLGKLESVARSLRVNMQAVLLAGLQAVLLRYTGQDDLVVGVPVAGRDRQETHGLVGYFINTLPVRCVAVEGASFADMVLEASTATLAALDHSLLPIEEVVAASGVARVPNANPLFQVLFQYLPDGTASKYFRVQGVRGEAYVNLGRLQHAKLDLSLIMTGESIQAEYMNEMFNKVTMERLLNSFVFVLDHLIGNISAPALGNSMLAAGDAQELAEISMGEERPAYLSAPLVHDAFDAIAAASPQSRCLCYEGEWLAYGEVSKRVSALADRLASLGVSPGVVVGVMLDRSFELLISILAVFKAGGVYLPCDPSYPDDRLEVYLGDASAVVVLTISEYAERARAMVSSGVSVVDLSTADGTVSSGKGSAALRSPGPDDPAYIIFTSGSTGRPKGVMIPHRAILDHVLETAELYSMGPNDASLLTITINFDPHLMQALTPLVVGAGLVIAKPDGHADGDYVTGLISQQRVTHFVSTPSLALVQFQGKYARECTALRVVMFGGEQLPREVITLFEDKIPGCRVYNVYGPTEATITATALFCPPSIEFISIGRPVYNLHCYVVDSELRAVPVGVPGELLLSGPRLALGYAGRPDLTAEKFVPNPCLDLVSGRVDSSLAPYYEKAYRTGDLVRWRNDGTIDFLGRIDRQVKITGVRIELGEVEGALESTPGVTQSVATALMDPSGQKRLVGYVTPATVEPATVRAHCRTLLVPAMIPTVIVALDSFPLLPGGKIDVRTLPAPDWSAPTGSVATADGSFALDTNDNTVISIILEVIGLEQNANIPLDTDIFDLGASSLHVSLIVGRMRRELGVNLDVREVYGNPMVKTLCDALRQKNSTSGGAKGKQSKTKDRVLGYPLPVWYTPPVQQGVQRLLSNITQLFISCLVLIVVMGSIAPGLAITRATYGSLGVWSAIFVGPFTYVIWGLCVVCTTLIAKWLVIGRYRAGAHPVWGIYHLRWLFVYRLVSASEVFLKHFAGTFIMNWYLRLMGASIGTGVVVRTVVVSDFDLITIGDDTFIGEETMVTAHSIERGVLAMSSIIIGKNCKIGMRSIISPDTSLDNGVTLEPMSMVPLGTALPPMTAWEGAPVRPKSKKKKPKQSAQDRLRGVRAVLPRGHSDSHHEDDTEEAAQGTPLPHADLQAIQCFGFFIAVLTSWVAFLPMCIAIVKCVGSDIGLSYSSYKLALVISFGFVLATLLYTLMLIPLKWIVLGRTVPGRYHINSAFGARYALVQVWCTAPLARMFVVLFANTYANKLLLRCLGADIGGRVMISRLSTLMLAGANHLNIEDGVVLNDDCALLPAVIDGDVLVIDPVDVEYSSFIADKAIIMPGSLIGKGSMISVQSYIPKSATVGDGSVWYGSPALCLDPGLNGRNRMETRWHFSMRQLVVNRKKSDQIEEEEEDKENQAVAQSTWRSRAMFSIVSMIRGTTTKKMATPHTDAFSLGALMAEEALDARGTHFVSYVVTFFVPFIFVPVWFFLAFFAPLKFFSFVYQASFTIPYTVVAIVALSLLGFGVFVLMLIYNLFYKFKDFDHGAATDFSFTILAASIHLASIFFLDFFKGTRWVTYFFSSMGSRVGKDVYLESLLGEDFGFVSFEDNVTVGREAMIVPVVIRDMKGVYKPAIVQAGATLGPRSFISSGSVIEARSALGPLSTAADGETIDEGCYAEGAPLMHIGEWWDPNGSPPGPGEEALQIVEEMRQDAKLAGAIRPPATSAVEVAVRANPPETVFLTGATGFVGGFILRELLKPDRSVKKVLCLVRASSPEAGAERIKEQLIHHELCTSKEWESNMLPRISVLPGDLGKPNLGLGAATLVDLADTVDVIINNGALVNVSKGYPTMRSANVDAVHTLLKICAEGSAPTAMYQISTVGTLPRGTGNLVMEDFERMDPAYLGTGYDQTKWVSEQLVLEASKRGLPVALLRLGRMGGDSQSGGANESDYFMLIVKGCLQMAAFPKDYNFDLNIVPSDIAARVIVDKALDPGALNLTYHVTNPKPPPFQLAVDTLRNMGYIFEELPYAVWRERLMSCAGDDNALRPLEMAFPRVRAPKASTVLTVDCRNAGIFENTLSKEQMRRDFEWCRKVGYFPPLPGPSIPDS